MFNFIQLIDLDTNKPVPMDFRAFRIVGFDEVQADTYIKDEEKKNPKKRQPIEFNHWLYGPCNNSSDTPGIAHLINFQYFEQSACIRKYYDKSKNKYYETGDPNFKWPLILKGCSHPNRTYYGVIVEKCVHDESHEKSGYESCKTDEEINLIINRHSLSMQLIDHYTDILNYETPFIKYFYAITNGLSTDYYGINHINFNPASIITHNGIFFDNIVKEESYFFTQNSQQIIEKNMYGCLNGFFFWMQNTLQYYERNYKRLQDIFSDIGGISSLVLLAAEIINSLVSEYIILYDTEELILSTENKNNFNNNINKKPTIFQKYNEINHPPPKKQNNNYSNNYNCPKQQQSSSNYQRLLKDRVSIFQDFIGNDEKQENYINLFKKRHNILNNKYQSTQYKNAEEKKINLQIYKRNPNNTGKIPNINNITKKRGKVEYDKKSINIENRKNKFDRDKNKKKRKNIKNFHGLHL